MAANLAQVAADLIMVTTEGPNVSGNKPWSAVQPTPSISKPNTSINQSQITVAPTLGQAQQVIDQHWSPSQEASDHSSSTNDIPEGGLSWHESPVKVTPALQPLQNDLSIAVMASCQPEGQSHPLMCLPTAVKAPLQHEGTHNPCRDSPGVPNSGGQRDWAIGPHRTPTT